MNTIGWILVAIGITAIAFYATWMLLLALVVGLGVWLWYMKNVPMETFDDQVVYPVPSPAYFTESNTDAVDPPVADITSGCPPPRSAGSCCGDSDPLRLLSVPICYPVDPVLT